MNINNIKNLVEGNSAVFGEVIVDNKPHLIAVKVSKIYLVWCKT